VHFAAGGALVGDGVDFEGEVLGLVGGVLDLDLGEDLSGLAEDLSGLGEDVLALGWGAPDSEAEVVDLADGGLDSADDEAGFDCPDLARPVWLWVDGVPAMSLVGEEAPDECAPALERVDALDGARAESRAGDGATAVGPGSRAASGPPVTPPPVDPPPPEPPHPARTARASAVATVVATADFLGCAMRNTVNHSAGPA
jgi:hypothetical protein